MHVSVRKTACVIGCESGSVGDDILGKLLVGYNCRFHSQKNSLGFYTRFDKYKMCQGPPSTG